MKDGYCVHEIIAEWCWECKHENPTTVKQLLRDENIRIVENLLSWEKTRTSSP